MSLPPLTEQPTSQRHIALRVVTGTLLALAAAAALLAILRPWPDTPDGLFHVHRVRALAGALASGVPWPRWFPDFAFGYGYPVLNFYAPAFYYPPALLHLAGLDLLRATQVALALLYGASGVATYLLLRTWTGAGPALIGALLYLAFPYRLYDLVVRGALPEFAAFFWLPWIALAAQRALASAETEPRDLLPMLGGAIAWTGLILTHNLTALIAALATLAAIPVLAAVPPSGLTRGQGAFREGASRIQAVQRSADPFPEGGAANYPWTLRPYLSRLVAIGWRLLAPLFVGAALAAPSIAPAIAEARWVGIGSTSAHGYANHFASWATLFAWQPAYAYPAAADPIVPAPGYVALLVVAGLAGAAVASLARYGRPAHRSALAVSLVLTLLALWLTTAGSEPLWRLTAPVLGKLQFPWRWQTLLPLTSAILLATLLDLLVAPAARPASAGRQLAGALFLLAAGALLIFHAAWRLPRQTAAFAAADLTREQMWDYDASQGQIGASWTGEFLPVWVTEPRGSIPQPPAEPAAPAPAAPLFGALPAQLGLLNAQYRTDTPAAMRLVLHRFFYPAWRVVIDGAPAAVYPATALGLLAVDVPAGVHTVAVSWQPTPAVWIGRGLAALAWIGVLALLLTGRSRGRRLAAAGWAVLGVAVIVLMVSPAEVTHVPTPVGADYGDVRLEAATILPAQPGEIAQVRLHWSVRSPTEEWVAFVHVVDENGAVLAQYDGPLAGRYTPVSRWQPGQVLDGVHPVALPADLAPGSYSVKAGLYPPGRPDQPRLADGFPDPRVDVGVLEVAP